MSHQFNMAVLKKRLRQAEDAIDFSPSTRMLLMGGQVSKARSVARMAIERFPGESQDSYDDLGVCEWLLGKKSAAIEAWRGGLHTDYRDPAGGIYSRLNLWWGGVMSGKRAVVQEALGHLEDALTSLRATNWPGPMARYVVGQISETELLEAALEVDKWLEGDRITRESLLSVGAKAFQEGNVDRARACFARCADGLTKALGEHRNNELLMAGYELAKLDAAAKSPVRRRRDRKEREEEKRGKGDKSD
jgi:hypothetical protein